MVSIFYYSSVTFISYLSTLSFYLFIDLFIYLFILTQVLESICLFEPKYLAYLKVHNANRNV